MTWRRRLTLLLGAASPFAVTGPAAAAPVVLPRLEEGGDNRTAPQPLEFWSDPAHMGHALQLAGHSSHRSHSSHSSHSSHVSGAGHASHYSGSLPSPAPVYRPPAPIYAPPRPPPPSPARTPPPASIRPLVSSPPPPAAVPSRLTQDEIGKFVQRVQIALMVKGYDPGPADGELSPKTRDALKAFQGATGLEASGNMDRGTLTALGVLK